MEHRLWGVLLRPSIVSSVVTALATLVLIGVPNWPYFTYYPFAFDFFFGEYGVITVLEQAPDPFAALGKTFISQAAWYYIGVFAMALFAGALTYVGAHGLRALVLSRPVRQSMQEAGNQAIVRLLLIAVFLVYAIVWVNILLPFCILLLRIGAEQLNTAAGWLYAVGAVVSCFVMLHVFVILARLFLFRPRVFGGEAVVQAATIGK